MSVSDSIQTAQELLADLRTLLEALHHTGVREVPYAPDRPGEGSVKASRAVPDAPSRMAVRPAPSPAFPPQRQPAPTAGSATAPPRAEAVPATPGASRSGRFGPDSLGTSLSRVAGAIPPMPVTAMGLDSLNTLDEIQTLVGDCQRCTLSRERRCLLFGQGRPDAALMVVGDFPSLEEDGSGHYLSDPGGELLVKILDSMLQLRPDDVYLTFALKCRGTDGRPASEEEIAACAPFLARQITVISPRMILVLGQEGVRSLFGASKPFEAFVGKWVIHQGIPVMTTHHPRQLLAEPELKRQVRDHMRLVQARRADGGNS